jgi:hypothetical protein
MALNSLRKNPGNATDFRHFVFVTNVLADREPLRRSPTRSALEVTMAQAGVADFGHWTLGRCDD